MTTSADIRHEGGMRSTGADTRAAAGLLAPVGRALFSMIYIFSGLNHFSQTTIGYAASHHVPMAGVLVPLAGVLALAGGLSILLGFHARIGAWLIVLFLIPVTIMMHDFWAVADPMMRQMQLIHFMKNVAMLGGALLIAYFGAGPVSFDARRGVRVHRTRI